jgi:DNA-binding CsgD family transcriptional regulator
MTTPDSESRLREPRVIAVTPASSALRGEVRPTPREYAVLAAVVRHAGYRGAAETLGISIGSVRGYLTHLRQWHHADNTTHLAAIVMRDVGDIFAGRPA